MKGNNDTTTRANVSVTIKYTKEFASHISVYPKYGMYLLSAHVIKVIYFQSIVIDRVFDVIDLYIFRVFSDSLKYLDIPVDNLVSNNHAVFLGPQS